MKKTTFWAIIFMAILGAIFYLLTQTKQEGTPEAPSEEEKPSDIDENIASAVTGNAEEADYPTDENLK